VQTLFCCFVASERSEDKITVDDHLFRISLTAVKSLIPEQVLNDFYGCAKVSQ